MDDEAADPIVDIHFVARIENSCCGENSKNLWVRVQLSQPWAYRVNGKTSIYTNSLILSIDYTTYQLVAIVRLN